jgi:integrase
MGRKKESGLRKRSGVWHIEKTVLGTRLFKSTGTSDRREAEKYLAHEIEKLRLMQLYGMRPKRTFEEATEKYLAEKQDKRSIEDDKHQVELLLPYIGQYDLDKVNMLSLQPFIADRKGQKVKNRTINYSLEVVRHILNLASEEWIDESNLTWLAAAPKIKLLPLHDQRKPYPLTWEEQDRLFALLPLYLRRMALFKVNTGLRDQEVCRLQWDWEHAIPSLDTSIFVVPGEHHKNKTDRVVVLNEIARQVIEEVRGQHPVYVFTGLDGETRVHHIRNRAWKKARAESGIPVRVHDLKHTFGRRLRAARVSEEDRQDLLGHKSNRITTHYSAAEINELIQSANKVCCRQTSTPTVGAIRLTALSMPNGGAQIAAN